MELQSDPRTTKEYLADVEARANAAEILLKDQDQLPGFSDFPAQHWIHLRTSNAIESAFSTIKARIRTTRCAGSRKAGFAFAFKLLEASKGRRRRVNAPHLVALVRAGEKSPDGEHEVFQDNIWTGDEYRQEREPVESASLACAAHAL